MIRLKAYRLRDPAVYAKYYNRILFYSFNNKGESIANILPIRKPVKI